MNALLARRATAALATLAALASAGAVQAVQAQAAAPTITLDQGAKIRSGTGGTCSITLTGTRRAYTARHCSHDKWRVGTTITRQDGTAVGTIAGIGETVDVVAITLTPNVQTTGHWYRRTSEVADGETLYVWGRDKRYEAQHAVSAPLQPWHGVPAAALMRPDVTEPGSSGGAVVDAGTGVVGVNVGGFSWQGAAHGAYIPWSVIETELD